MTARSSPARTFARHLKPLGYGLVTFCLVHTDVRTFGRAKTDGATLLKSLAETLIDAVGPAGTLVVPTFSYSFCKNEVFDVQHTPATVGVLNEYFRGWPRVKRTSHPIFSVAVWGEKRLQLLAVGDDCFGQDSIFALVHRLGGKIVFFGCGIEACTFIHYVEQSHGIPYRYFKTFSGTVVDETESRERRCTYFVRYLDASVVLDLGRLNEALMDDGAMKGASVGDGRIFAVDADVLYRRAWGMLDADIFSLLREPPVLPAHEPK